VLVEKRKKKIMPFLTFEKRGVTSSYTQITDSLKELIKDDNIIIVYKISFNKIT
jgi:hypothetical protein